MLPSTLKIVLVVVVSGAIAAAVLYLFPAVFHVRPAY